MSYGYNGDEISETEWVFSDDKWFFAEYEDLELAQEEDKKHHKECMICGQDLSEDGFCDECDIRN